MTCLASPSSECIDFVLQTKRDTARKKIVRTSCCCPSEEMRLLMLLGVDCYRDDKTGCTIDSSKVILVENSPLPVSLLAKKQLFKSLHVCAHTQ